PRRFGRGGEWLHRRLQPGRVVRKTVRIERLAEFPLGGHDVRWRLRRVFERYSGQQFWRWDGQRVRAGRDLPRAAQRPEWHDRDDRRPLERQVPRSCDHDRARPEYALLGGGTAGRRAWNVRLHQAFGLRLYGNETGCGYGRLRGGADRSQSRERMGNRDHEFGNAMGLFERPGPGRELRRERKYGDGTGHDPGSRPTFRWNSERRDLQY